MRLRITSIFLILILGIVGTLGFLWFSSMEHGSPHLCIISVIAGGDCSSVGNILAAVNHHISGLQYITQSIVDFGTASLMLFLLILITVTALIFSKLRERNIPIFLYQKFYLNLTEGVVLTPKKRLLKWIALHNKRDPHALYRVHGTCPEFSRGVA